MTSDTLFVDCLFPQTPIEPAADKRVWLTMDVELAKRIASDHADLHERSPGHGLYWLSEDGVGWDYQPINDRFTIQISSNAVIRGARDSAQTYSFLVEFVHTGITPLS